MLSNAMLFPTLIRKHNFDLDVQVARHPPSCHYESLRATSPWGLMAQQMQDGNARCSLHKRGNLDLNDRPAVAEALELSFSLWLLEDEGVPMI